MIPLSRKQPAIAAIVFVMAGCGLAQPGPLLPTKAAQPPAKTGYQAARVEPAEVVAPLIGQPRNRWQEIILHHSGSPRDTVASMTDWHVNHNKWRALGYHFVVLRNGQVHIGERWRRQWDGAHCVGHNASGIGVCLIGDFREEKPTDAQLVAAAALVDTLLQACQLAPAAIKTHRDFAQTECPGEQMRCLTDRFRAPKSSEPPTNACPVGRKAPRRAYVSNSSQR